MKHLYFELFIFTIQITDFSQYVRTMHAILSFDIECLSMTLTDQYYSVCYPYPNFQFSL